METKTTARLAMLFSGILMGFVGLFVRALSFIPTFAIVSLRGLFGAIILFSIILVSKNTTTLKVLFKKTPVLTIAQGFGTATTVLFYFYTIQNAGFGYAAFLLYCGPIFCVLFMWIFLKKVPKRWDLFAFFIALMGIALMTKPWEINIANFTGPKGIALLTGILSGLSLGMLSTIKVALFEKLRSDKEDPKCAEILTQKAMILNLSLAAIATSLLFLVFVIPSVQYYPKLTPGDWGIAILLGLLPTAIAFALYNYGLQSDKAGDVIIFSYAECIVGSLLTAFVDKDISVFLILGGILILISNFMIAANKEKK